MTKTRAFELSLFTLLLCSVSVRLPAQSTAEGFVIDPNRPYLYLKFDHIGRAIPRWKREPSTRTWLQLTNNCRVPVVVDTYAPPDGSPEEEQGVMDRVAAAAEIWGMGHAITSAGTLVPKPLTKPRADEMPRDYSFEVGSFQSILPGTHFSSACL